MLRLVLPKGSLERATLQLFDDADLGVSRASDVAYRASIDDPRIDDVRILRPQEIPAYVAEGLFDLGITGRDCVEERGSAVVSLGRALLLEGHQQAQPGGAGGGERLTGHQLGRAGRPPREAAHQFGVPRASRARCWPVMGSRPTSRSPMAPRRRKCPR